MKRVLNIFAFFVLALILAGGVIGGFTAVYYGPATPPPVDAPPTAPGGNAAPAPGPKMPTPTEIAEFVDALSRDALAQGVRTDIFQAALMGFEPDAEVVQLSLSQPEFSRSAGDYVQLLVSETRIETGRDQATAHARLIGDLERRFGVDGPVLVAIWGVESNFGTSMGQRSVVRSLATLAMMDTRRPQFWRLELLAALRILQRGDIKSELMVGSWAGAMGHTQFIPTTYEAHAVDADGDGKRDIWQSIPDGLGSTANYLKVSGWDASLPWGFEVRLAEGFDFGVHGPGTIATMAQWTERGVVVLDVQRKAFAAPGAKDIGTLTLHLPAGARGPAFLTTRNFRAILRYNNAVSYALAVAHLSDRIAGRPAFVTPWPADDKALTRAEREELQSLLVKRGLDIGAIDGFIGTQTRTAIRAFQKSAGLIEDGHPNGMLLAKLRNSVSN